MTKTPKTELRRLRRFAGWKANGLPNELVETVLNKARKSAKPYGYVAKSLRNRQIDAWRKRQRDAGRQARVQARLRFLDAKSRAETSLREAKAELSRCLLALSSEGMALERCLAMQFVLVEQMPGDAVARELGVSKDVVYQWRKRTLARVLPKASNNLAKWIGVGREWSWKRDPDLLAEWTEGQIAGYLARSEWCPR